MHDDPALQLTSVDRVAQSGSSHTRRCQCRNGPGTRMPREISLTSDLVALVDRSIPERGRESGLTPLADEAYCGLAEDIFRKSGGTVRVFAYGSLIWKPESGLRPLAKARAFGWRRSYCLNLTTFRGTPDEPGLMLALDHGGCCDGMLMQFDGRVGPSEIERMLRREMDYVEDVPHMRWLTLRCGQATVTALTFFAAPRGDGVFVRLSIEEQARRIARAAGSAGSCAAYLHNTVMKLAEHDIVDGYLWKLQELVAKEIRAQCRGDTNGSEGPLEGH